MYRHYTCDYHCGLSVLAVLGILVMVGLIAWGIYALLDRMGEDRFGVGTIVERQKEKVFVSNGGKGGFFATFRNLKIRFGPEVCEYEARKREYRNTATGQQVYFCYRLGRYSNKTYIMRLVDPVTRKAL